MVDRLSLCRNAGTILAVFCAIGLRVASAQAGGLEQGELAVFGGAGMGAGTHGAVGGSAGLAFSRYGMGLFEFSFMPMGNHTIQPWPAPSALPRWGCRSEGDMACGGSGLFRSSGHCDLGL